MVEKLSRGPEAHRSRCSLVAAGAGGIAFNAGSIYRREQVNDRLSIPACLVDPTSRTDDSQTQDSAVRLSAPSEVRFELRLHTTD